MRRDLPRGLQAAQIAHAAGEAVGVPQGTYVVVLGVDNEEELREVARQLNGEGHLVVENDPPHSGEATALGTSPRPRSEIGGKFKKLRLL